MTEKSRARTLLYRQMMAVPHRNWEPMVQALRGAFDDDPDFISKACVHLATGGSAIRDQQDVAIITLLRSPAPLWADLREAGRCLLLGSGVYQDIEPSGAAGLPPFRVFRIERFIRDSEHKIARMMRSVMTDYVRALEASPGRFDGVAIRNRKRLTSVYTHYHIKPADRAQAVLFDNNPPADSRLAVLKEIAKSEDIREQIRLVMEHKIPFVVAASVLPKITPAVAIALIDVMTPTECLNARKWIEQTGVLTDARVREVVEAKLAQATASIASSRHRRSAQGQDAGLQAAVEDAREVATKTGGRIERDTLILVDKSGSMEAAIAVAKQFLTRIAPLCDGERMIVAFDAYAREIKVQGDTLKDHERAFRGIRAGGQTSVGVGLQYALRAGFVPEQVVVITDGEENQLPDYAGVLSGCADVPHTIELVVGTRQRYRKDALALALDAGGHRYDRFVYTGDYYSFDQIVNLLAGERGVSLVETILATELPCRASWRAVHEHAG